MPVKVRFAPSPTGRLHIGNARMALVNWLFARRHGGSFMLRLDDTDRVRSRPEFAEAIETDLRWLGLEWGRRERQSDRLDRYRAAFERLVAAGRAYPCYETPTELGLQRKAQLSAGKPPRYDRGALKLDAAARAVLEGQGRRPHWRLLLDDADRGWTDLVRGPVRFAASSLSDPVIVREDGDPLYLFTSVVDDIELGITHVIRGEDHVANTAVQLALAEALGAPADAFTFAHLPLMVDAAGGKLSKRTGSLGLGELREAGIEPMTIASLLARLGSGKPVEAVGSLHELAEGFDLAGFGRAPPKFDAAELDRLNPAVLRLTPWEAVRDRLPPGFSAPLWLAIRANVGRLAEAVDWAVIVSPDFTPPAVADAPFRAAAAAALPPAPWDEATWPAWTAAVKQATGRSGKALFQPLRLALTGREHGPEMKLLLPLIGREAVLARLAAG